MTYLFASLLCCILAAGSAAAADSGTYTQSYSILIKGMLAGNETVTEKTGKNDIASTSEHDMIITDGLETKRMTFSTKLVLSRDTLIPISYSYQYVTGSAGDSYNVSVKDGRISRTLSRGGHVSEATALWNPDMVMVDFSVYHQYDYLIRKYDDKKKGRQAFINFVPLIANGIPMAVTFLDESKIEHGKTTFKVRNYRLEFIGIWTGTLSVDAQNRLVRLTIPNQDLEVVRKDLFDESARISPQ
jgi:hypothetical protein